MPRYRYQGISSTGEAVDGVVEASSEAEAVELIRASGVFVTSCERVAATADAADTDSVNPSGADDPAPRDALSHQSEGSTRDDATLSRRQAAIFLSLFTLGGLFFALLGGWSTWLMSRQLERARPTKGTVRAAKIAADAPEIRYVYQVGGLQFESNRIYPGGILISGPADNPRRAERFVREHPPGSHVTVWYLPDEPEIAFLQRVRGIANGLFSLGGGILAIAGAGLLLPQIVRDRFARFSYAIAVFLLAQGLTWLLWEAFLAAPREELDGSPRLLQWLLVAYLVVCWVALIGNSPPPLKPLRDATLAGVGCGTISMSLSLFVLVPLTWFVPRLQPLSALPWIGVGMCLLGLVLWMCGCVTIRHFPDAAAGADDEGEKLP